MKSNLGTYIQKLRKEQGLTQKQLADGLFCTQQYIGYVESGKRAINNCHLLPLSRILKFNFIKFLKEEHKYKTVEHYLLAHELIDLLVSNRYKEIALLLQNKTIKNEFNYGSPLIIKEYCSALVNVNVENKFEQAEKTLFKILKIESRDEIKDFVPTFNNEDRYYSCIPLLSIVLCKLGESELSLSLLTNTINFLEQEFFNKIIPHSSIDSYFEKLYIVLLNNYADELFCRERYEEALEVCNKVEEATISFESIYILELILKLKIEILYKLDMISSAQDHYNKFYVICEIKDSLSYLKEFNITISKEYPKIKITDTI